MWLMIPSVRIHTKECALAKTRGKVGGTLRKKVENTWGIR